ncbi:MAG: hypothetical protein IAI50_17840 [Candidatus Eremiobacteraeota bacterium]|nr:hypothetical protein [Candidatus Eremiobacteraeota bacterium]
MLGEALFRNIIMDGVVSNAWMYSLIENLTKPVQCLVTSIVIVAVAERSRTMVQFAVFALAIATAATFLFDPAIATLLDRLTASFEYLDTGNIYNPPYGWQVDVPSYLTFVEPVVASFAIGFLVREELSPRPSAYTAQLIFLIMAMKGSILPTLLFSFFLKGGLASAILSESQFSLEVFVMAFLTAVGTRSCLHSSAR